MIRKDIIDLFRVTPGKKLKLKDHNPGWNQSDEFKEFGKDAVKDRAKEVLDQNLLDLAEAQSLLYADDRYSVLIVLQAMDAAGKDGTIKHVMSGVNPQGCQVFSFKKPSAEELERRRLEALEPGITHVEWGPGGEVLLPPISAFAGLEPRSGTRPSGN